MSSGGKASHNLTMNANLNFSMKFNFNKKILILTKKISTRQTKTTTSKDVNMNNEWDVDSCRRQSQQKMFFFFSFLFWWTFSFPVFPFAKRDLRRETYTPRLYTKHGQDIYESDFHFPLPLAFGQANFHPQKVYSSSQPSINKKLHFY